MKTCVIANPRAGSSEQAESLREELDRHGLVYWEATELGSGKELAGRAVDEGFECVVAAGGDGTVHEVANGLLARERRGVLGIIPLGTGNDLARTLRIPAVPEKAVQVLLEERVETIDVIEVHTTGNRLYCINAAAGGFSGQVDEVLTAEMKKTWGPMAYLIGAATVLPDLTEYRTSIGLDEYPEETIDVYNIVVANGRTVAGGKRVAPQAHPQDGLLDVVIIKRGSLIDMAEVSTRLLTGTLMDSPHVIQHRVSTVRIRSTPGMWFNVDGELLTKEPITFTVRPRVLPVIVGPEFRTLMERVRLARSKRAHRE